MFNPWMGAHWGKIDNYFSGARILVLGEAHYCGYDQEHLIGSCQPDLTSEVVKSLALSERHRFFTNLTQVLAGKYKWSMPHEEVDCLWNSIMFYNYIPVFASNRPRVPPTYAMFQSARLPFRELRELHAPEIILVCGYRLWAHVISGLPNAPVDPGQMQVHDDADAVFGRMMHPSAGFSSVRWQPFFRDLLKRGKEGRKSADTGPPQEAEKT